MDLRFERPRLVSEQEHEPAESLVVDDPAEDVLDENVPEPNVPEPNVPEPNVPEPNVPEPNVPEPNVDEPNVDDGNDDDESWRDEVVADIFDRPPSPKPPRPEIDYGNWIATWIEQKKASELEDRSRKRKRRARLYPDRGASAHVCTEEESTDGRAEHLEVSHLTLSGEPPRE